MEISYYANNGECHLSKDDEAGLCGHDLSTFALFGQCRTAKDVITTLPYIEGLGVSVCIDCLIKIVTVIKQ